MKHALNLKYHLSKSNYYVISVFLQLQFSSLLPSFQKYVKTGRKTGIVNLKAVKGNCIKTIWHPAAVRKSTICSRKQFFFIFDVHNCNYTCHHLYFFLTKNILHILKVYKCFTLKTWPRQYCKYPTTLLVQPIIYHFVALHVGDPFTQIELLKNEQTWHV